MELTMLVLSLDFVILMLHGVAVIALRYITLYSNFMIFNYDSQVSGALTNRWAKFTVLHF
jgi:hypothetical protein